METSSQGKLEPGQLARDKWGDSLDAGFQILPNVLLRTQKLLGLDPTDLAIVLNITMHWWDAHDLPYPRPSMIAKRIGVSPRTVERRLSKMESAGLLERLQSEDRAGRTIRRFKLNGLVTRLTPLAQTHIANRRTLASLKVNHSET